MPKLTEEEKAKREQLKAAIKIATKEERSRDRATTTVEKIRQFEADFKEAEERAHKAREEKKKIIGNRDKELADMNLSVEERRNKEIDRLHDFYDLFHEKDNTISVRLNNYKLINLLRELGYYRYDDPSGSFQYVKIEDNIISIVKNEQNIIDFFEDYIRKLPTRIVPVGFEIEGQKTLVEKAIYPELILEKIYKNISQYFSQTLPRLRPINEGKIKEITTVHDTLTAKYIFFKNVVLRISKDGREEIEYKDINSYIANSGEDNGQFVWNTSILDREYYPCSSVGMFQIFIQCICGLGSYPEQQIQERMRSLKAIFGYLMHDNYECNLKAVVFTDAVIDQGVPSGGTGKGLIGKALGHIINKNFDIDKCYISVPGKDFDTTKDTRYSSGDATTHLIHIEDAKKEFKIEDIFGDVTENVVFRRLHHDPCYHKSKIMISTNYPFDTAKPSVKRRVHIFELHNYFNAYTTPIDVLGGRMFESNWTDKDWLAYDNFMIEACEEYMRNGLSDLGEINYSDNVLNNVMLPEVNTWFKAYFKEAYIKKELTFYSIETMWKKICERYPDIYKARNSMTRDFKTWLRVKGIPSGVVRSTTDMLYLYPPKDQDNIEWILRPDNRV